MIVLLLLAVAVVFTACAGPASSDAPSTSQAAEPSGSTDGETLVYGSGDYTSINPALYEHGEINLLLFSGLTAHDGENKIVPSLAKEWTYDEDDMTYTFYLRQDVTWHDGEKFTAEDVKFTLEAIKDPKNQSEIASN